MSVFSSVAEIFQCYDISGLRSGLVEVIDLLRCYAALFTDVSGRPTGPAVYHEDRAP